MPQQSDVPLAFEDYEFIFEWNQLNKKNSIFKTEYYEYGVLYIHSFFSSGFFRVPKMSGKNLFSKGPRTSTGIPKRGPAFMATKTPAIKMYVRSMGKMT